MVASITLGAIFLTAWDFVLDPAMSQTTLPFWVWEQPGAFFGMPYQNFAGWFGTGAVFMTVATLIWKVKPFNFPQSNLGVPLAIYVSNFAFAMIMSLAAGIYIPVLLGLIVGLLPVLVLYRLADSQTDANISENLVKVSFNNG